MTAPLTIAQLFTPASAEEWRATLDANANTLQLKTTSWEAGSPSLTLIEIVARVCSQEDGAISLIAQGGFLDFAASGTVTYTDANGQTVTVPVTPEGGPGWLDVLAASTYDVTRTKASFATGSLAIGNTAAATLSYAAGTYHVENLATGATYSNAEAITIPQGKALGGGITFILGSFGAPPSRVGVVTASAHGLVDGDTIVISDLVGIALAGLFTVAVITPTSFYLNGTEGTILPAYAPGVSGGVVRATSRITITADLAGTAGTSNAGAITQAVTTNSGVLISNPTAIVGRGVETNVQLARRCRAKLPALSICGPRGAYEFFALSAADILGNADNPRFVAPAVTIPAITRVATMRNRATGVLSVVVASVDGAVGGVTNLPIAAVSSGTPIAVITAGAHGLATGDVATVSEVVGATPANGTWTITVTGASSFTLNGSTGGGTYLGGGVVEGGVLGEVDRVLQANAVPDAVTMQTTSASETPVSIIAAVEVPADRAAAYAVAAQTALALFTAALPIGGLDGLFPLNDVIGVLYAAGIPAGSTTGASYVRRIPGVLINGIARDLAYSSATAVASLTPPPAINVVGV